MSKTKTWDKFSRYHVSDDFWGCVRPDGTWFDSSESFSTAIHWCCYASDQYELSPAEEMEWFQTQGKVQGWSIIHGRMIRVMYEAGLIK
jgi:hypothetical protein